MHLKRAIRNYLIEEIFPQISPPPFGKIDIQSLANGKPVYLFTEKNRQLMVVGKSFQYGRISLDEAWISARREYDNLKLAREKLGMDGEFYEIVPPLGKKKDFCALLVTRKACGNLLDHYIARAIYQQKQLKLFQKLGYLARFFAKLHGNSRTNTRISSELPLTYMNELLKSLRQNLLSPSEIKALDMRASPWWNNREIWDQDMQVIVHGDATPMNFFFHQHKVIGIDLERMKYADRCWDLGFMAAELKHHFLWHAGDKWASEPFIGHFLWEYATNPGDIQFFYRITGKLPLYMALGLLRIARNQWLNENYRKMLVEEARLCLKYGQ
jgi:hypothetical protein